MNTVSGEKGEALRVGQRCVTERPSGEMWDCIVTGFTSDGRVRVDTHHPRHGKARGIIRPERLFGAKS